MVRQLPAGLHFAVGGLALFLAPVAFTTGSIPGLGVLLTGLGVLGLSAGALTVVEARNAQEELERAQAKAEKIRGLLESQRTAIDALADGLEVALFVCDSRGVIEYANRMATMLFALQEPVGKPILKVTLSHDLEALAKHADLTAQAETAELKFTYPEERIALAKAWRSEEGRVFLSVIDITQLRRLERIRQDFVANVSHELRTPLTIIRAMAETLTDDEDPDTKTRYLHKIMSEVDRLSSITQDLLVLSVAEGNPVRKYTCDLAEVVRAVVGQLRPRAQEKGLELVLEAPAELEMQANASQMTQVALNLIENAINYTAAGSISVRVCPRVEAVLLEVEDTGIGIARADIPRIFERFYRIDKARSRSTGGTGLGLSIVKHIVEAHGGTVSVESALNEGSTFTVYLPRA
jgi:two-component system phosphate regulon sensor histidine kinase PhoR